MPPVEAFLLPVMAVLVTIIAVAVFLQLITTVIDVHILAFVITAVFGLLFWWKRRKLILLATIVWLLYGFYELEMLREGANIRVDMLVGLPILFVTTAIGIGSFFWSMWKKR